MAAKKIAKKTAKGGSPEKKKKTNTVSIRLDDELDAFLREKAGDEAYAPIIRKMIREAKEREEGKQ